MQSKDVTVMDEETVFNCHLPSGEGTIGIVDLAMLKEDDVYDYIQSLELDFMGIALVSDEESFVADQHIHNWHDISFMMKGELVYEIKGEKHHVKEGDIAIIPPDVEHREICENGQPFEVFFLCVNFTSKKKNIDIAEYLGIGGVIAPANKREVYRIFKSILSEVTFRQKGYLLKLNSQILNLLVLLTRNREGTDQHIESIKRINGIRQKKIADDIKEYIKVNYQQKISLSDLSRVFYFTPQHISSLFKKQTGYTIIEYLNTTRIGKAKEFFEQGDDNISYVSEKVGFSDMHYFCKVFKQYENQTPARFISQVFGSH